MTNALGFTTELPRRKAVTKPKSKPMEELLTTKVEACKGDTKKCYKIKFRLKSNGKKAAAQIESKAK